MTSDTKIQALDRLNNWATDPENLNLLGAHAKSVQKKLRKSKLKAKRLDNARGVKPTIGIYGPSQAGKSYLTAKFAENNKGILSVNLDKECDFLKDINPPGGRESTALVSRFTTGSTVENKNFPLKARLLTEADLVCIFANSYFNDNLDPVYPENEKISEILDRFPKENTLNLSQNNIDFVQIEQYLEQKVFPKELREKFSDLWLFIERLEQGPNISERCEIYSILWNFNKDFSELFLVLCRSLNDLGHLEEIFLPISSVLPREKSIIDVSTLKGLDSPGSSDQAVVLAGKKEVVIRKSVLSALISELFLTITSPSRSFFQIADLLDFPGARTRFEKPLQETAVDGIHEFFLRGKIDFLFQKFSLNFGIDALIFCVDPGPFNIRELPKALDDWIQISKTDSKEDAPKLFFTLTKFDMHFPDAAGRHTDEEQRFQNALDSGLIQPFSQGEASWPNNWNGSKFRNVFPLRNPNYPLEGYFKYDAGKEIGIVEDKVNRLEDLKKGFLRAPLIIEHVDRAEKKWEDLISVNGGGASCLADSIESLSLQKSKDENLNYQIRSISTNLYETLSVFEHVDDDDHRFQKELQKYKMVYDNIDRIGTSGKFQNLLNSLIMREDVTIAALTKEQISQTGLDKQEQNASSQTGMNRRMPSILDELRDEEGKNSIENVTNTAPNTTENKFENWANIILASWINSISTYDTATTFRLFNTDLPSFDFITTHIAHEIQISKIRNKISEKFKHWTFGLTLDANVKAIAKLACEEINNHVCFRENETDDQLVGKLPISRFTITEISNELSAWDKWLKGFENLLKVNCISDSTDNVNLEQNQILVESLESLRV